MVSTVIASSSASSSPCNSPSARRRRVSHPLSYPPAPSNSPAPPSSTSSVSTLTRSTLSSSTSSISLSDLASSGQLLVRLPVPRVDRFEITTDFPLTQFPYPSKEKLLSYSSKGLRRSFSFNSLRSLEVRSMA